jgi:2-polyprenyl-3-methyl-5-hydroxy-6-metoxy-1,4-benzoquinol methylase
MAPQPPLQPDLMADVWDAVARGYADAALEGPDNEANLRVLLRCLGGPAGKSVCEVGCGSGATSAALARMGARVVLVDIAAQALHFARQHFQALGLPVACSRQDGLHLAFADATFDVVWNGGVVEHFYDDGKVRLLQEMWRVLRPGGDLVVLCPNRADWVFALGRRIMQWRGQWSYGYEDDLTPRRAASVATRAAIPGAEVFAYNPVVAWWFLPGGRRLTARLGLDTAERHAALAPRGHVLCLHARKPAQPRPEV